MTPDLKSRQYFSDIGESLVNFVVPIILVAISAGALILYVFPTFKNLSNLKTQAGDASKEVSNLQAKVDQLKYLEGNRKLVVQDLVKMSWALEERDKVPELTEQVRVMSADSGVIFISLDYANANKGDVSTAKDTSKSRSSKSSASDADLYREEKVNATVGISSVSSITRFLHTTENSIRLFRVESLRISASKQGNRASLVMASPYLNPTFSAYSDTSSPIDLSDKSYRGFMERLDTFKNYAQSIDATLPKL